MTNKIIFVFAIIFLMLTGLWVASYLRVSSVFSGEDSILISNNMYWDFYLDSEGNIRDTRDTLVAAPLVSFDRSYSLAAERRCFIYSSPPPRFGLLDFSFYNPFSAEPRNIFYVGKKNDGVLLALGKDESSLNTKFAGIWWSIKNKDLAKYLLEFGYEEGRADRCDVPWLGVVTIIEPK